MKNVTMSRIENQISWYDSKSAFNKRWFYILKIIEFIGAGLIPLLAGKELSPFIVGGLGSAVFILEGIQQLFQFHNHWNDFRSTCEDLKHEKYLFLAKAGPYSKGKNTNAIFAERVEALTSKEHSKWVGSQKAVATAKIRRG